jgi:plasmid maintenance system antidote protein VapI
MRKRLNSMHPGEVLREDFLIPMSLSSYAVARACGVPRTRILRLARYFATTPAFWMGMQAQHDLEAAQDRSAGEIDRIEPLKAA